MKYHPTEEDINTCYKYLHKYKYHWNLSDDDVQDIVLKFFKYYTPNKGASIHTFTRMLMAQLKVSGKLVSQLKKNASNGITRLDYIADWMEDDSKYLAIEDAHPMEEHEQLQLDAELIQRFLGVLTQNQREVIEFIYINELTIKEVANKLGISGHAVQDRKQKAIKKMQQFITQ